LKAGSERHSACPWEKGPSRPLQRSARRLLFVGAVGLCLGATSTTASAFCRSRTCAEQCMFDETTKCPIDGVPIAWTGSCLSYSVQRDGTSSISHAELSAATDAAFQTWQGVTCPAANAPPSISIYNLFGITSCSRVEFNSRQANANIVVLRDEWEGDASALGLTTVSLNRDTGQIYDVDIEINGTQPLSVGPLMTNRYDLESILTHEVGHFFGIAHSIVGLSGQSCNDGATMCPYYAPGVGDFRTLDPDDIAAICAVYPPDRSAGACDPTPHRGFSPECGMDPITGGSCSAAMSSDRPPVGWMTALVFGCGLAIRQLRLAKRRIQKLT